MLKNTFDESIHFDEPTQFNGSIQFDEPVQFNSIQVDGYACRGYVRIRAPCCTMLRFAELD